MNDIVKENRGDTQSDHPLPQGTAQERAKTFEFLRSIGIEVREVTHTEEGFLDDVRIVKGGLDVAPEATLDAILHEAGHLSIIPKPFRYLAEDDVDAVVETMFDLLTKAGIDCEDPLYNVSMYCSDVEATAWAWAAGTHLKLDPTLIILDSSYDGEGESIRTALNIKSYLGIHGLMHAGFCHHGWAAKAKGLPLYPETIQWTQDGPFPSWEKVASKGASQTPRKRVTP